MACARDGARRRRLWHLWCKRRRTRLRRSVRDDTCFSASTPAQDGGWATLLNPDFLVEMWLCSLQCLVRDRKERGERRGTMVFNIRLLSDSGENLSSLPERAIFSDFCKACWRIRSGFLGFSDTLTQISIFQILFVVCCKCLIYSNTNGSKVQLSWDTMFDVKQLPIVNYTVI